MLAIEAMYAEAASIADGMCGQVLAALLSKLSKRESLSGCERHAMLHTYVMWKRLAGRQYNDQAILTRYKAVRKEYKSKACSCWQKRR